MYNANYVIKTILLINENEIKNSIQRKSDKFLDTS